MGGFMNQLLLTILGVIALSSMQDEQGQYVQRQDVQMQHRNSKLEGNLKNMTTYILDRNLGQFVEASSFEGNMHEELLLKHCDEGKNRGEGKNWAEGNCVTSTMNLGVLKRFINEIQELESWMHH